MVGGGGRLGQLARAAAFTAYLSVSPMASSSANAAESAANVESTILDERAIRDELSIAKVIGDFRGQIFSLIAGIVLGVGASLLVERKRKHDLRERINRNHLQISLHTLVAGEMQKELQIDANTTRPISEILSDPALTTSIDRAISKKLSSTVIGENYSPFLDVESEEYNSIRYLLIHYCVEKLRQLSSVDLIEKCKNGGKVIYKNYVAALTFENYPGPSSNRLARLILVPEDEMEFKDKGKVSINAGSEHQGLRIDTHNLMVQDWKRASDEGAPEHCFLIRVPHGVIYT